MKNTVSHNSIHIFSGLRGSILLLTLITLIGPVAEAQTNYASTSSGNWNTTTTWSPNGNPGSIDNVNINGGHIINLSANAACRDLTVNGTLNIGNYTFTLNNNFNINGGALVTMGSGMLYFRDDVIGAGGGSFNC